MFEPQHASRSGTRVQVLCFLKGARLTVQFGRLYLHGCGVGEVGVGGGLRAVLLLGGMVEESWSFFFFLGSRSRCRGATTTEMVEGIVEITPFFCLYIRF